MTAAPLPPNEAERLQALDALNVLYTPAEDRFDRITRLACRLLDVPIALVSLVDRECQWFKSVQGLPVDRTPRAVSFCAHAILGHETLIVEDATRDERFADNPLVTGAPHIRFYLGHPVLAPDGSRLGTLCAIDTRPRAATAEELETLRDLAGWVTNELRLSVLSQIQTDLIAEHERLQRAALIDDLTRLWNRKAIVDVLNREADRSERAENPLAVMMIDVDHFKDVNDTHGHLVGDEVLRGVARHLRSSIRPYDAVGRYGGEEFLAVLAGCGELEAATIAERIRERVAREAYPAADGVVHATLSVGFVVWNPASCPADIDSAIAAADRALYRAKAAGRNQVVSAGHLEIEEPAAETCEV